GGGVFGDLRTGHGRGGWASRPSTGSCSCSAARASSPRPARSPLAPAGSGGAARGLGCGVLRLCRILPTTVTPAVTVTPATGLVALATVEDLLRLTAALGAGRCGDGSVECLFGVLLRADRVVHVEAHERQELVRQI